MTWWVEPTQTTPCCRSAGYTLIELLVVMGIIGVVLGAAGLALRSGQGREQLAEEADRLEGLYDLARAHANAHATVWTLRLGERHYQWQPVQGKAPAPKVLTREHRLPAGMLLRFLAPESGATSSLSVWPGDDVSEGRLLLDRPQQSEQGSEWLELSGHGPAQRGGIRP